ncbi:MAG: hypothetical protein IKR19_08830 [Acholeplasmatales bacterium]|nr:hypothetical protein [Acholeplasmatales bacterium]
MILSKDPSPEYKSFINGSPTLAKYKSTLRDVMMLYYPAANPVDIDAAIDYSIKKRFRNSNKVRVVNSYKRYRDENDKYKDLEQQMTLQKLSDYILSREPIVTANGVMFKHHGEVPNPMNDVIQSFLSLRSKYKKQMFTYPKNSEGFEKYNLLQSLAKIDANGELCATLA